MNDVKRILRAAELEGKCIRFYNLMEKKRRELGKCQGKCRHEIVVFTKYSHCYGGYDDNLYQKCLFCGKESASRQSFYHSRIIDVSRSINMEYYTRQEKFEIVKRLYIKIAISNPGIASDQIQKMVEAEIENPTNVFWEIAHAVLE